MSRVMSVGMYQSPEIDRATVAEKLPAEIRTFRASESWNPEKFAREQIRGLVRQVFFAKATVPVRQVVFGAVDNGTDVRRLCRLVGEALALETSGNVAVAGEYAQVYEAPVGFECGSEDDRTTTTLRQTATKLRSNLWLVPFDRAGEDSFSNVSMHSHLCNLRREFGYSIIEGVPAGTSHEATAMAQLADGIVLVLSAHRTRRAAALNVKEQLEAARVSILGFVLGDREFPIPEKLYQHL
jgi:hypothetical protein